MNVQPRWKQSKAYFSESVGEMDSRLPTPRYPTSFCPAASGLKGKPSQKTCGFSSPFISFLPTLCYLICCTEKNKRPGVCGTIIKCPGKGGLRGRGRGVMQLYFSAHSFDRNCGLIATKSFIVLCNEDTKHLVEITIF